MDATEQKLNLSLDDIIKRGQNNKPAAAKKPQHQANGTPGGRGGGRASSGRGGVGGRNPGRGQQREKIVKYQPSVPSRSFQTQTTVYPGSARTPGQSNRQVQIGQNQRLEVRVDRADRGSSFEKRFQERFNGRLQRTSPPRSSYPQRTASAPYSRPPATARQPPSHQAAPSVTRQHISSSRSPYYSSPRTEQYQPRQQQQQHQQQQQQQQPKPKPKPSAGDQTTDYHKYQKCFYDEETQLVVFKYRDINLAKITPSGDVMLNTNDNRTPEVFNSLNDVLSRIGFHVTSTADSISAGNWKVSDGRSFLSKFTDGMTLPSKGPATASRAGMILQAFTNSSSQVQESAGTTAAAAASAAIPSHMQATLASTIAAAQLGLVNADALRGLTMPTQQQLAAYPQLAAFNTAGSAFVPMQLDLNTAALLLQQQAGVPQHMGMDPSAHMKDRSKVTRYAPY